MLPQLIRLWRVDNSNEVNQRSPEVIALVSFGALANGNLTRGTTAIDKVGLGLARKIRGSVLIYGAFTHSTNPEKEKRGREKDFHSLPNASLLYAGKVESTVEEAETMKKVLEGSGHFPHSIVVVTGECHSRTARWVWENVFPESDIYVKTIPFSEETDPSNPMVFNRDPLKWFIVNVCRHIVFQILGYRISRTLKLQQPTD